MDRANPYECAFEAYLREQGIGFIAVDETRRSTLEEESVKSLDFLVCGPNNTRLLIDVKGRKFPGGHAQKPRFVWQNWVTQADINGLLRWQDEFGEKATALFVFVYKLQGFVDVPIGTADLFFWKKQRFLMRAILVQDYKEHMRQRSVKWGTVHIPMFAFRKIIKPFSTFCPATETTAHE